MKINECSKCEHCKEDKDGLFCEERGYFFGTTPNFEKDCDYYRELENYKT